MQVSTILDDNLQEQNVKNFIKEQFIWKVFHIGHGRGFTSNTFDYPCTNGDRAINTTPGWDAWHGLPGIILP